MTLQTDITPTKVSFPAGTVSQQSEVIWCQHTADTCLVVTEQTPFHPVSHIWPDHPADRGTLCLDNTHSWPVADCVIGAWDCEQRRLYWGGDIPVKRDTPNWHFVVVHCLPLPAALQCGQRVTLMVDRAYQNSLSRAHSGAHLAALALNRVLQQQGYWRKDASRLDALGQIDFHSYAEQRSEVSEDRCLDSYRMGKTLRKRGFNSAEFIAALPQVCKLVNTQLALWLEQGSAISLQCDGPYLTDSRYWQCQLDNELAVIPCGGTHIDSLSALGSLTISLALTDDGDVEMTTYTQA